jgi:rubredoxin
MATMRCKCGTVLREDHPDLDYLFMSRREFDVDLDSVVLRGRAHDMWRCWTCERIWVFWDRTGQPTEYLQGDSEYEDST